MKILSINRTAFTSSGSPFVINGGKSNGFYFFNNCVLVLAVLFIFIINVSGLLVSINKQKHGLYYSVKKRCVNIIFIVFGLIFGIVPFSVWCGCMINESTWFLSRKESVVALSEWRKYPVLEGEKLKQIDFKDLDYAGKWKRYAALIGDDYSSDVVYVLKDESGLMLFDCLYTYGYFCYEKDYDKILEYHSEKDSLSQQK